MVDTICLLSFDTLLHTMMAVQLQQTQEKISRKMLPNAINALTDQEKWAVKCYLKSFNIL